MKKRIDAETWGIPDWKDGSAYLPWDAPVPLWIWEFQRRSESWRNMWRAFELGALDDELKQEAENNPVWNGTVPQPIDPRKCGWWWEGQPPRAHNLLFGTETIKLRGKMLVCNMLVTNVFQLIGRSTPEHPYYPPPIDLAKPLAGQLLEIRHLAEIEQARIEKKAPTTKPHSKLGAVRTRKNWPGYLRVLDAKDSEPDITFAAISKVLYPLHEAADKKVAEYWRQAQALRDGDWLKLCDIAPDKPASKVKRINR